MWIIQFEDNLGNTNGILAHGAEDRGTCEILMQEYARNWASEHPEHSSNLMYSRTEPHSANPGLTIGVEVGNGLYSILLEMAGYELHGVISTQVLNHQQAESRLMSTMFETADVDDLTRE